VWKYIVWWKEVKLSSGTRVLSSCSQFLCWFLLFFTIQEERVLQLKTELLDCTHIATLLLIHASILIYYSPLITCWSPQGMWVLWQCKVPRVEVMFVTIQCENIRPSKKEMNKPGVCSYSVNHSVSLSLTNRKSSVHLHALYSPRTALRMITRCRDHLMICGHYVS
jgi:hypothetical protein